MNIVKAVGFDPSMQNLGIVQGHIDLTDNSFTPERLRNVRTEAEKSKAVRKNSSDLARAKILIKAMQEACRGAGLAFAELPVGSKSARAMASYGMSLGVIAACPLPLIQVLPVDSKLHVIGRKDASKQEIIDWARAKFPEVQDQWLTYKKRGEVHYSEAHNEHIADAIAAVETGIASDQFSEAVAMMKSMMG